MNKLLNVNTKGALQQLAPEQLDQIAEGDRRLWGMEEIAQALSVSRSTAKRWRDDSGSGIPITRVAGRWTAMRRALRVWLQGR